MGFLFVDVVMSKEDFPGLIRSGSSHSVSVSERTGNAKTPKNYVQSADDKAAAKKIEFEKKIAASNDAKKALADALDQHDENVAGGVALDQNIQSVEASSLESNTQKLASDKAANQNRQSIDADASSKANIRGINTDSIDVNLQTIGSDNIAANRQNIPQAKGIASNVQGIGTDVFSTNTQSVGGANISTNLQGINSDSLSDNNQNVGQGNIATNMQNLPSGKAATANVQEIPIDGIAANHQTIDQSRFTSNIQSLTKDKASPNNQGIPSLVIDENRQPLVSGALVTNDNKTAKFSTVDNSQRIGENTLDSNNQPTDGLAPSLNIQGAAEDGPSGLNRQTIDEKSLEDHFEGLPSGKIERSKVDFSGFESQSSTASQQGLSIGVANKKASITSVTPEPIQPQLSAQQAAKLKQDKFKEAFQSRVAGIKQKNDSLISKLDAIEKL